MLGMSMFIKMLLKDAQERLCPVGIAKYKQHPVNGDQLGLKMTINLAGGSSCVPKPRLQVR